MQLLSAGNLLGWSVHWRRRGGYRLLDRSVHQQESRRDQGTRGDRLTAAVATRRQDDSIWHARQIGQYCTVHRGRRIQLNIHHNSTWVHWFLRWNWFRGKLPTNQRLPFSAGVFWNSVCVRFCIMNFYRTLAIADCYLLRSLCSCRALSFPSCFNL